jgi:hypothetical protein
MMTVWFNFLRHRAYHAMMLGLSKFKSVAEYYCHVPIVKQARAGLTQG